MNDIQAHQSFEQPVIIFFVDLNNKIRSVIHENNFNQDASKTSISSSFRELLIR